MQQSGVSTRTNSGRPLPGALMAALIAVAGAIAYANSFGGVFVFDDVPSIVENPAIRTLTALGLGRSTDITVSGRPVGAWSLAANYAISGLAPWSYHAVNLLIHICAALLLLGVVRRLLARAGGKWARPERRDAVALIIALLWVVHPLTVPSVTYVVQRFESLGGLFTLAVIYAFIRAAEARRPVRWQLAAVVACALGMATKETVAAAPILVLLVDRALYSGKFAAALRLRWPLHASLAGCWAILAVLVLTGPRARVAGEFAATMTPLAYFEVQFWAITHYLALAFWPAELVLDYGSPVFGASFPADRVFLTGCGALLAVLAGAGLWLLARNRPLGVAFAAFFLILGPSSSFIPLPMEVVAEHRMYLPLAALLIAVVTSVASLCFEWNAPRGLVRALAVAALLAVVALGWRTWQRNVLFHDETALWTEDVRLRPANVRARTNLARALSKRDHLDAAIGQYLAALRLRPDDSESLVGMGSILLKLERYPESIDYSRRATAADPNSAAAWSNLGQALSMAGRRADAIAPLTTSLRLDPGSPITNAVMGDVLAQSNDFEAALKYYRKSLDARPDDTDTNLKFAQCLELLDRHADALAHLRAAAARRPADARLREVIRQLDGG